MNKFDEWWKEQKLLDNGLDSTNGPNLDTFMSLYMRVLSSQYQIAAAAYKAGMLEAADIALGECNNGLTAYGRGKNDAVNAIREAAEVYWQSSRLGINR